jgi:hypothetical protein
LYAWVEQNLHLGPGDFVRKEKAMMKMKHPLLLIVLAVAVFIGTVALVQPPPRPSTRRQLSPNEVARVKSARGYGEWNAKFFQHVGVSKKLNDRQLEHFRGRGTDELFLLRYLAEAGITPEESAALEPLGVQMALSDRMKMGVGHWAALSDLVVIGEVEAVRGNTSGPYRSSVDLRVTKYLKDRPGRAAPRVTGVLLRSGPRTHNGHTHDYEAMEEPDIKRGEKVVLFLSSAPLNLVSHLGSVMANTDGDLPKSVTDVHGSRADLVRTLDNPTDLEIVHAYKVVQDKAVFKARAYRVPTPDDVVDLASLTGRVQQIAAAQARGRS